MKQLHYDLKSLIVLNRDEPIRLKEPIELLIGDILEVNGSKYLIEDIRYNIVYARCLDDGNDTSK